MRAGQLLAFDPPEHTRLRRMLTPEFTVRRMRRLEPRIAEIVEAALDDMERAGKPADLMSHFALPVPSLVICELLGVPYADRDGVPATAPIRLLDISCRWSNGSRRMREDRAYMSGLVARAQSDPGEDMLGMLVREHGDDLSTDELVGIAGLLLLAGHETTSNMLGLGTLALLRHSGPAGHDPRGSGPGRRPPSRSCCAGCRWCTPLPPRTTTTDVTIAGARHCRRARS